MHCNHQNKSWPELHRSNVDDHEIELKEIVLGVHWDPPDDAESGQLVDLDALCVLFDASGQVLEVIHPGHPRSSDGCVTHTGDSRTGTSCWDDERIFVFLEALPEAVAKLAFAVLSVTGKPFDAVPGARCHVSDRISETPHVQVELTALCGRTAHAVAVLRRGSAGWQVSTTDPFEEDELLDKLKTLVRTAK
jgi:tellurium resistance protein TerZ